MTGQIEFLLEVCVTQRKAMLRLRNVIDQAVKESGFDPTESVLETETGQSPQHRVTIAKLMRQIDKQNRWLEKRRVEVAELQQVIVNRREKYKSLLDKYTELKKNV